MAARTVPVNDRHTVFTCACWIGDFIHSFWLYSPIKKLENFAKDCGSITTVHFLNIQNLCPVCNPGEKFPGCFYKTKAVASSADVYTSAYFALQNACWESAPNPFVLHFSMQAARPGGTLFIR